MEALVLLILAVMLGIPGATRALAFGLLGPVVLLLAVLWLAQADYGQLGWWLLGIVVCVAALGWDGMRQAEKKAGNKPR